MGMNIKSERAHQLARQLAQAKGLSVTAAVEQALEAALEQVQRQQDTAERKRRLREILDRLPPPPPGATSDHSDLYDEWGLPA